MREINFGASATVRLIEGVRLIRCPLNTGFTVMNKDSNLIALQLNLYPKATLGTEESGRWGDVTVMGR